MAFLSLDTLNATTQVTDVHSQQSPFTGKVILSSDSLPASTAPSQNIDGIRARGQLTGCGVLGEGGDNGAGVVGVAGGTYTTSLRQTPRGRPARHDLASFNFPETAQRAGVFGRGRSQATFGVLGESEVSVGVAGFSNNSIGVVGHAIGSGHPGCAGIAEQGIGVIGQVITTQGQQPDPDSIAVWGVAISRMQNGAAQYFGHAGVFDGPVAVNGKLTVTGDLVVTGAKSAAVRHRDGSHRLLYCVESPESWFEDFGEGRLAKGRSRVRLDAAFASLIGGKYHVFLTPYGDSRGLYVSRRSARGFEVREQQGGKNNLEFSYRIVAKRGDVAGERLAKVKLAPRRTESHVSALLELDRARAGRRSKGARR